MRLGVFGSVSGFSARARAAGLDPLNLALDEHDGSGALADRSAWLEELAAPRVLALDLAAGPEIDVLLDDVYASIEPGDLFLDLSPSWWSDTVRRHRRLKHRSIFYVDAALLAPGPRPPALLSGDPAGVAIAQPVLSAIAGEPVRRLGCAGAAHFAAQIADSVAAARAQALSDARQMLEAFWGDIDSEDALDAVAAAALEPSGRANWSLDDAARLEASAPTFAQAAMLTIADRLDDLSSAPPPPRLHQPVGEEELDP